MEFIKFPHIKNLVHAEKSIQHVLHSHPDGEDAQWVATEKVDGSNFQFTVTADDLTCYSRNFILGEERTFHNFQRLREKYRPTLRLLFDTLAARRGCCHLVVRVYGEVFGGLYPGVKLGEYEEGRQAGACGGVGNGPAGEGSSSGATSGVDNAADTTHESVCIPPVDKPVQDRVFYLPAIDFYLFDITYARTDLPDDHPDSHPVHLDTDDLLEVGAQSGFTFMSQILHRGTFSQLQELDPDFLTTLPATAGLPTLEGNTAEGYVLTPLRQVDPKNAVRVKLKSVKFCEVESLAAGGQKKERPPPVRRPPQMKPLKPLNTLTPQEEELEAHLLSCVNPNRLYSVKSKLESGDLKKMHPRRLTALLIDDAMEEIVEDREDLEDLLADLDKVSLKKVRENVYHTAYDVVEDARAADH